ncbi:MAG: sulfotransferase [Deinococcales bacterium]
MASLIIAGFHRSGTSLMAQLLNQAGLFLGDRLMAANSSNLDGHFEDHEVVDIHEKILKANTQTWQYVEGDLALKEEHVKTIRKYVLDKESTQRLWGFKDPRVCLFLDVWKKVIPQAKTLMIYRHYVYCWSSLLRRAAQVLSLSPNDQSPQLRFWLEPPLALNMWISHHKALLKTYQHYPQDCLIISHEKLLKDFDLIATLKTTWPEFTALKDIKPQEVIKNYSQHEDVFYDPEGIDQHVLNQAEEIWQNLQQLADNTDKPTPVIMRPNVSLPIHLKNLKGSSQGAQMSEGLAKLSEEAKTDPKLAFESIQTALKGQQTLKAQALIDDFKANFAVTSELNFYQGRVYLQQSNYEAAIAQFLQVTAGDKPRPYHYISLADAYLRNQQYAEARQAAQEALERNPKQIVAIFLQIRASFLVGDYARADHHITHAQEIDPAHPQLQRITIARYLHEQAWSLALQAIDHCLASGQLKDVPLAQWEYICYLNLGQKEQAEQCLKNFLKDQLHTKDYQESIKMMFAALGDASKASLYHYLKELLKKDDIDLEQILRQAL